MFESPLIHLTISPNRPYVGGQQEPWLFHSLMCSQGEASRVDIRSRIAECCNNLSRTSPAMAPGNSLLFKQAPFIAQFQSRVFCYSGGIVYHFFPLICSILALQAVQSCSMHDKPLNIWVDPHALISPPGLWPLFLQTNIPRFPTTDIDLVFSHALICSLLSMLQMITFA